MFVVRYGDIKRPEQEADNFLPFSADVNPWVYTSIPPCTFMGL